MICFITSVAPTWGQVSGARPPILSLAVDRAPVPLEFGLSVKDAEEEYVIDVVPGMVRDAPDSFAVDLYQGVPMEARRIRSRTHSGHTIWSGHLYFPTLLGQDTPAGYILLLDHGDHVSGIVNVFATNEDFQILGNSKGEHRLVKLSRVRTPTCGVDTRELAAFAGSGNSRQRPEESHFSTQTLLGTAQIKVLAVVPEGELSQDAEDFIETSVEVANEAFYMSGIDAEYEFSVTELEGIPSYSSPSTEKKYLQWMNNGNLDDVRDSNHADMVVLFLSEWDAPYCGFANLRFYNDSAGHQREEIETGFAWREWTDQAFSVQIIGCGLVDLTFGHELGHNFSLRHDAASVASPVKPLLGYPDPNGHLFWTAYGERATVMGCVDKVTPACDRTFYFSNPNFTVPMFGITPTGRVDHPNGYYANAFQVLTGLVPEYADLRTGE